MVNRDKIQLRNLTFYANHGVNPEERALGQRFVVDVTLFLDLRAAGQTDDLSRTINYAEAFKLIRGVVEGTPRALIEAVAEDIAAVLLSHTLARRVMVRVAKPWAPVKGMVAGDVAVEIERTREE